MRKKLLVVIRTVEEYILEPFLFVKNALNVLQNGPPEDSEVMLDCTIGWHVKISYPLLTQTQF